MKTLEQRINIVIGQLGGIKEMLRDGRDCKEVIIQLKATKTAVNVVIAKYLESQIVSCKADTVTLSYLLREISMN